jgi:hypothetical protein
MTRAEFEAWIELGWDQVLGRFGGVLSPLNRHAAPLSKRPRRRARKLRRDPPERKEAA